MLLATGCQDRAATGDEAAAVATTYLANDGFNMKDRVIQSRIDMGDRWRLSYGYPGGGTGGPIIVVVNKRSGKVVHVETEQ
jgi:hypothetical protein